MKRRLRIAYVYRNFNRTGSIPNIYVDHAERLARTHDVTAVCSAATREPTSAPLRFETVEPRFRGQGRVSYALECATFALDATRFLRRSRSRFDLIHVEGFAATEADVVSVHAVRPAEIAHYFDRLEPTARARRRLHPVLRPQSGVVLTVESRLFRPPYPFCLAISASVAQDLGRHYGVPNELIEITPIGVDRATFCFDPDARARVRAERGVEPDALVLLFVGDDFARKGLGTAIQALSAARRSAELWVVGGGDREPYRALAARLGAGGSVHFLGRLARPDLAPIYSASDVLVLPSRQDVWGHPVVEAMAAGRVAVTSEYTGSHEVLDEGESGFTLPGAGTPADLAALIDGPLSQPDVRQRVGLQAAAVTAEYDSEVVWTRFLTAHERAYEHRLASHAPELRSERAQARR